MLRRRSHATSTSQARRLRPARIEVLETRALLATFTAINTLDSGPGSLRQAILDSNTSPGADVIAFAIGSGHQTITLASPLPTVTDTATIDGSTQPGFAGTPIVEIDGNGLATTDSALLHLTGANSTVKGLVINNVDGPAIWPQGVNYVIQGCYLGTDVTGGSAQASIGNNQIGIEVNHSSGLIGGTGLGEGNLISGFNRAGIEVDDLSPVTIQGNLIGTNATGAAAVRNASGIMVGPANLNVVVGGTATGAGNLISGNDNGILANSGGFILQGNKIGTDITGTAAIPNQTGVRSYGGGLIGGTAKGAGNLISGNSAKGVDGGNFVIQGNLIGTDASGGVALKNYIGVEISASTIGGTAAGARNVISGNQDIGINDRGQNTIQGNYIGTDATGEIGLGGHATASIDGRFGTGSIVIGNVISSGNPSSKGIYDAHATLFQGNFIGSNKDGTRAIGNRFGFFLDPTTTGNTIGGTTAGTGNLISGNGAGLYITNSNSPDVHFSNNLIQGNLIGTDISGAYSQQFSDREARGIYLESGVAGNTIGGTTPGSGNVIAYNNVGVGMTTANVTDAAGYANSVLGNSIHGNFSQGIVLAPYGSNINPITPNDPGGPHAGPNHLQNYPVLTVASTGGCGTIVAGTFNSNPDATFRIEIFASAVGDPSGYGQGGRYLGYLNVTTDGSGNATFSTSAVGSFAAGEAITATATAPDGSTSEFSAWVVAVTIPPSSVSGLVFSDFNDDGQVDFGEQGIPGVAITLAGTDDCGQAVNLSQTTDGAGAYVFPNLRPGHYTITETQPAGYTQGINTVGTGGGTVTLDTFDLRLAAGLDALNYNYGERPAATGAIQKGQTAGIGFWNNKNGQALINALNGGATSTQLGNWMAATFPHMFGALSGGNNLAGKSNAAVASFFQSRFVLKDQKLDAQVLATALAVYVTDGTLDNTGVGTKYGFTVGGNGVGTSTFNVGTNGAAFGVADGTIMTVMDILLAADAQSVNGVLYGGNATKRNKANAVFSAINQAGGI